MKQAGTAVLVTMLVATFLLASLTVLWRSVSISYESAMLDYKSKKNFYACESLIWYTIGLIKHDLILLNQLKPDQKQIVYQGNWPKTAPTWGVLTAKYNTKRLELDLEAKLFDKQHLAPIIMTRVLFTKDPKQPKFKVTSWKHN